MLVEELAKRVEELELFKRTVIKMFPEVRLVMEQDSAEKKAVISDELRKEIDAPLENKKPSPIAESMRPRDPLPGEE